jgi:choline dehydrogenase-like flavoprotein
VKDLPGVGSELASLPHSFLHFQDIDNNIISQTDHLAVPVSWEVPISESMAHLATSTLKGALEFFKYIISRTGLLTMPIQSTSLFVRSSSLDAESSFVPNASKYNDKTPQDFVPDIELMPIAFSAVDDFEEYKADFSKIGIFTFFATILQPKSRGTVRLASSSPHDRAKVDFNFFSHPSDLTIARAAVRLSLKLGADIKASGFPLMSGVVVPDGEDDEEVDRFVKRRSRSALHYGCTCRMTGEFDKDAPGVVDDELRVHGVKGVRVADASVFPKIISTHLQAAVVMVAEKCADVITENWED